MAIIGTICPRIPGHLNPMTTLCRELQRRGHRVIFYQAPMAAEKIRSRGFEVRCFGEKEYSLEEDLKNQQVLATLYHVLGIDPATTLADLTGRPIALLDDCRPIVELIG